MPQKLTTTACFIQEESSGGKGCSGKFLRHILLLYVSLCLYVIEHSFVFRKPKLSRFIYIYIYIYIYNI